MATDSNKRAPGHYWVKKKGDETWDIAHYSSIASEYPFPWSLIKESFDWEEAEFEEEFEIGNRIPHNDELSAVSKARKLITGTVYFLDTEFNEGPVGPDSRDYTIDLISIGIKARDGRSYYAINFDFNWDRANDWVRENVISQLPPRPARVEDGWELGWRSHEAIAREVQDFLDPTRYGKPEIWANFNSYDWVAFCWLWGVAVNLPKNFPFYCRDLKQEADRLGITREMLPPKNPSTRHHALADAEWNEKLYDLIQEQSALCSGLNL